MRHHIVRCLVLSCTLLGTVDLAAGQQPKYGVTVQEVKPVPLATATTYVWMASQPSEDKDVDRQIIAAVDRELAARGFKKLASGKGDVSVTYRSLTRTDVDLRAKPDKTGALPRLSVGTLVVDLREPANLTSLYRVRMDTPIDADRDKLEATVSAAVAAMFEKYPPRTAKK